MNSSILPRYADKSVTNYTTTDTIRRHQPELLDEQNPRLMIQGGQQLPQLGYDSKTSHEQRTPGASEKPVSQFSLYSPNVMLTGHTDEVLCCAFNPQGTRLVTGGMDKAIFIWDLPNKCQNVATVTEFKNAITDVKFTTDGSQMIAASADKTVSLVDSETLVKTRKFAGHTSYVNCIDSFKRGFEYVLSGSNDKTIRLWDHREKSAIKTFQDSYQVLSISTGLDYNTFYSGGLDNAIKIWDVRKEQPVDSFVGHTDSVTSLNVSHEGSFLLSNSMDNTLRVWDLRPFSTVKGQLKLYKGHLQGYEKNLIRSGWNYNGRMIASGSSDKNVYIWDSNTKQLLLTLGGHGAVVNAVSFCPVADIIASVSSDRSVILTELPKLY
jgi:Prp8 binding protein